MDIEYLEKQLDSIVNFYEFKRWYYSNNRELVEVETNSGNIVVRGALEDVVKGFGQLPYVEPDYEYYGEEEPDYDDSVLCCPNCEKPNQFGEPCISCENEEREEN